MDIYGPFSTFLDVAPDALLVVDVAGRIVLGNSQAERLLGYHRDELVGRTVEALVPERYRVPHAAHRHGYFSAPRVRPMGSGLELFALRKDGTEVPVEISLSPLETQDGTFTIAAIRDISERKRAEAERVNLIRERAAKVEAEAASKMKDEFLATLSHELRTPLNAILGWARLLRSGAVEEGMVSRALETIERNAKAQATLVEEILDVSRMISGKLQLQVRSVDLVATIEAAIEVVRPAAEAKGVLVEAHLEPASGPVAGDPDRLEQVAWNLLANAVKFTPRGGKITVRLERIDDDVKLTVADSGRGIDPAFLPYLFDRFRQADCSTTRAEGGLGLGLAIARHLVELHGGTIAAHSDGEGRGATFAVSLPVQREPFAQWREPVGAGAPARLDGVRVLVVDDEADERELFTLVLESHGAEIRAAADVAEAFALFDTWPPDVLVSDIAMPAHDGYELVRRIRSLGPMRGGDVPAVAVTAHARIEDRDRALAAGFQRYVAKPIEPERLVKVVAALARRR